MLKKIEAALGRPSQRVRGALAPWRASMFWTTWVLVGIVGILIVWDVVLAFWDSERPNTWSEVARAASHRLPILPWFLGALVGHLFHGGRIPVIDRDAGATLMGTLTLLVIGWSAVLYLTGGALSILSVTGTALAGVVVSYLLWPLHRPGGWRW